MISLRSYRNKCNRILKTFRKETVVAILRCWNYIWDDGVVMECLLEGTQDLDGKRAPKQISTYNDKSILGAYLRKRLGVTSDHIITYED